MANIMAQQWNDMASMESKEKEKALKIKNELICQKFDKTTYHNKNGENVLRKKQTKNIGYKNTQRQTLTMPCEQ